MVVSVSVIVINNTFLFQVALKVLQQSKVLTDPLSLDNTCLVNQDETADSWPLICDPQRVSQSLVTALNEVTIVKFKASYGKKTKK